MKKFKRSNYFAVAVVLIMLFSCISVCGNSLTGDVFGSPAVVYAAEEKTSDSADSSASNTATDKNEAVTDGSENAEIPTIGASENTEDIAADAAENTESQKKEQSDAQDASKSTFFKWAIPITCVLSLVLAIFLAIRKANKKFGKEWE